MIEPLCKKGIVGLAYGSGPHILAYTSGKLVSVILCSIEYQGHFDKGQFLQFFIFLFSVNVEVYNIIYTVTLNICLFERFIKF